MFRIGEVWVFTEKSVANAKEEQGEDYDPDGYAEDRGAAYLWWESDETSNDWDSKEQYEAALALSNFIEGNEDIMERAFGDHATITVTSEKLTVEECSHD